MSTILWIEIIVGIAEITTVIILGLIYAYKLGYWRGKAQNAKR